MRSIFKTEMLINQSKVNLHEQFLFVKSTHHLDPEIRTMLVKGLYENENSTFHLGQ